MGQLGIVAETGWPVPVAARSEAQACGRSNAGIAGANGCLSVVSVECCNNNNNNNKLQLGCYPVAVVILHVYKI